MNNTNSKTGLAIAILVLVIINIATLITFWCTTKKLFREHKPPQNGSGAANFLIKQLGFDSIQKEKYLNLVQAHQQEVRKIKEQAKDEKEAFFSLLSDTTISEENIKTAAAKASSTNEQIDVATFHHFQQVRSLCTTTQKTKFDSIIKDVLMMMAPQGPHPPPPGNEFGGNDGHRPPPPDGDGFPPPPNGNPPPQ